MKKNYALALLCVVLAIFAVACNNDPNAQYTKTVDSVTGFTDALADESVRIIKLGADLDLPATAIEATRSLTIDFAGHTLSSTTARSADILLVKGSGVSVTLKDSSTDGKGGISYTSDTDPGTSYRIRVSEKATLTIESGTYKLDDKRRNNCMIAAGLKADTPNPGTVNIKGGTFEGYGYCIAVWGGSTLTVDGGTFTAHNSSIITTNGTKAAYGNCTITVNGGTFNANPGKEANDTTPSRLANAIYQANSGKVTVKGGTFNIDGGIGILMRGGELDVTGSTAVFNHTNTQSVTSGHIADATAAVFTLPTETGSDPGYDLGLDKVSSGYPDKDNATITGNTDNKYSVVEYKAESTN